MSSTSDALVIEGQVADKLIDLLSQSLDKINVTEQERDSFKQQAGDLLAKSKSEDQTNAAAVTALTAKFQAMIDKTSGATPAPAAPATPPAGTVTSGTSEVPPTPPAGTVTSGTSEVPPTPPAGTVTSGTSEVPPTPPAGVQTSNDGTPNTPVVNTNPAGDTGASTTAK